MSKNSIAITKYFNCELVTTVSNNYNLIKVTVQFERCFRLMEHISVSSCPNPINIYITDKLIKFSKSLFNFYLVISNR